MNERISIDPQVHHGQPVIRGTRVPVALVIGALAGGMDFGEVEGQYDIVREDIQAALEFAAQVVRSDRFFTLTP